MATQEAQPLAAVIMAVHRPQPALFHRMLASLTAQKGVDVIICAVVETDDALLDPSIVPALESAGARLIAISEALGVKGAFARGLEDALSVAQSLPVRAIAYADQDDVWHGDKLGRCMSVMADPAVALVHCDARVVSAAGKVIAPSLHKFERRQTNHRLLDHLLLNGVTGMTAVFSVATGERALRLMRGQDSQVFHDHITALAAAAGGAIAWIAEPLADYVQHDGNQVGAISGVKQRPWWQLGWLFNVVVYRGRSMTLFLDRRLLVLALDREGIALGDMRDLFLVDPKVSGWRVFWAYVKTGTRFVSKGQFRHWHLMIRCADVALFRRQEALALAAQQKTPA